LIAKELRENICWFPIGLLAFSIAAYQCVPSSANFHCLADFYLLSIVMFIAPALAFALGILQSVLDLRSASRAYLHHRSVWGKEIVLSKILSGFFSIIFTFGVPFPFEWIAFAIGIGGVLIASGSACYAWQILSVSPEGSKLYKSSFLFSSILVVSSVAGCTTALFFTGLWLQSLAKDSRVLSNQYYYGDPLIDPKNGEVWVRDIADPSKGCKLGIGGIPLVSEKLPTDLRFKRFSMIRSFLGNSGGGILNCFSSFDRESLIFVDRKGYILRYRRNSQDNSIRLVEIIASDGIYPPGTSQGKPFDSSVETFGRSPYSTVHFSPLIVDKYGIYQLIETINATSKIEKLLDRSIDQVVIANTHHAS